MAQAIPLLGSLLLARMFAPAEFGSYAAWLGLVSIAAVLITGRYEVALALEHDGEPRRVGVFAAAACIGAGGVVLLLVIVVLVAAEAPWLGVWPAAMLWSAPGVAMMLAALQTLQTWAAADGHYGRLNRLRIVQAAAVTGLQLAASLRWPSGTGLALAHGAGALLALVVAVRATAPGSPPAWSACVAFMYRHRRFPALSLPADSVNTAASQLPLLIVASRFGADVAGLLALTMRTLSAPVSLLAAAVLDVFKRRAASAFRERGECRAEYVQTAKLLSLGAVSAVIAIGGFSEAMFAVAFGEIWRGAGTMALWLMPMFALRFVASPLSYTLYVAGRQQVDLAWQIALLVTTVAALSWPDHHRNALLAYSGGYSAMYLIYLYLSYRCSLGGRA